MAVLKELYTSISTLAQKLVLTLLNDEFVLEILNSTPFRLKIRKYFRPKKEKGQFWASLLGFSSFFLFFGRKYLRIFCLRGSNSEFLIQTRHSGGSSLTFEPWLQY